jgi:hypothetical protein
VDLPRLRPRCAFSVRNCPIAAGDRCDLRAHDEDHCRLASRQRFRRCNQSIDSSIQPIHACTARRRSHHAHMHVKASTRTHVHPHALSLSLTHTHKHTHPPRRPPALTARWQAWTAKGMGVTSRLRELTAVFLFAGAHCDARSDWLRAMRLRSALVHRRRPIVRCAAGVGGTSELVHPLPPQPWPCGPPQSVSPRGKCARAAYSVGGKRAWPRGPCDCGKHCVARQQKIPFPCTRTHVRVNGHVLRRTCMPWTPA